MSELELNRFRKLGGAALREEYSHCEVPAGCGGVVMRWVLPGGNLAVSFRTHQAGKAAIFIDGEPHKRAEVELSPGSHVIGVVLDTPNSWMCTLDTPRRTDLDPLPTLADGSWMCSRTEPPKEWLTQESTPAGFQPMVAGEPASTANDWSAHTIERLRERGAEAIAAAPVSVVRRLLSKPTSLWIRRVVHVGEDGRLT